MLKRFSLYVIFIFILCLDGIIFANESVNTYFSFPPGSYWVYEDQDGNELKREVDEDKVFPLQTFHAFSYEPALEEWYDYIPQLQPNRFSIDGDDGVTFYNNVELEKFIKARLTREIEILILMAPPEDVELNYEVTSDISEQYIFLHQPIELNEEWDTHKLIATLEINVNDPSDIENEHVEFNFSVIESGTVIDIETVEIPAGTFEDCLKIEYRTETELNIPLGFFEDNPPGETVTTLWLAPNVGIVKCHREMEDMLLKTAPIDEIPFTTTVNTLELKDFEVIPTENGTNNKYFPVSPGSYWVYVDQDGNELTRRAIEDEVIPEKRLKAYKHKPAKENWENYSVYTDSKLYEVTDDGLVIHVGDGAAKAVQARLNKELDVIEEITNRIQESEKNDPTSQEQKGFEIKYEVDVNTQELFQLLPNSLTIHKEWEVAKVEAKADLQYFSKNTQNLPNNRPFSRNIWGITIVETGKILGKETVETPAGKFNDCLKVEFRSETAMDISDRWQEENAGPPGETITTLWLAPNVGIVKYHKKSENIILKAISKSSENEKDITEKDLAIFNAIDVKTLELKRYEIKTDNLE